MNAWKKKTVKVGVKKVKGGGAEAKRRVIKKGLLTHLPTPKEGGEAWHDTPTEKVLKRYKCVL